MKNADDAVEKVLAGLRKVEAPLGLEERVRDRVRRRVAEADRAQGRAVGFFGAWRWMGVACAAMVLLVLGIDGLRERSHYAAVAGTAQLRSGEEQASAGRAGESVPQPRSRSGGKGRAEALPSGEMSSWDEARSSGAARYSGLTSSLRPLRSAGLEKSSNGASGEGGAEAISFPAPPLPLTEQERLLLRVANHSGPEEVAMLDPIARARQDTRETTVFLDFFGRPESVERTNQNINRGESR